MIPVPQLTADAATLARSVGNGLLQTRAILITIAPKIIYFNLFAI
jgi:hypothetical protein